MGEGWGEGEYNVVSLTYIPLPLIPSRQGRGKLTFYDRITVNTKKGWPKGQPVCEPVPNIKVV